MERAVRGILKGLRCPCDRRRRLVVVVVVTAGLIAAVLVPSLVWRLSPGQLPTPSGSEGVGRRELLVTDHNRADPFRAGAIRALSVFVFYPAQPNAEPRAAYAPGLWAQALDAVAGGGSFLVRPSSSILGNGVADAPSASGHHPLLLFEPGYGKTALDYTALLEDLASQGFVVAAITPTGSAPVTVLDGQIVHATPDGLADETDAQTFEADLRQRILPVWIDDFASVRSALAGQAGQPWSGQIDATHVGLFGHSFGGASSFEACARFAWCAAAVDIDGTTFIETEVANRPRLLLGLSDEREALSHLVGIDFAAPVRAPHMAVSDLAWRLNPWLVMILGQRAAAPEILIRATSHAIATFFNGLRQNQ